MWEYILISFIFIILLVVAAILYMQQDKLRKEVNEKLVNIVDQINDSQMYGFKFDKQQEQNIQNNDKNVNAMYTAVSAVQKNQKFLETVTIKKDELEKNVTTANLKTNVLNIGDKFSLSGASDDDWLNVTDKSQKTYYGGLATKKIYTKDNAYLNGTTYIKNGEISNKLKIGHTLSGWTDNAVLSTYAQNGKIGASFGGQDNLWSYFPYNENTYIRPGKNNGKIMIGDVAASSVEIGKGDTLVNIKGTLNTSQIKTPTGQIQINGTITLCDKDGKNCKKL